MFLLVSVYQTISTLISAYVLFFFFISLFIFIINLLEDYTMDDYVLLLLLDFDYV